ncbi:hypothetical protein [Labrys sp. ZIDIC5]|uniref:hypothetical protein n=1 Tax=Labrys sedimenti TaxID=3106036 RepID=UPI002ACA7963|nr:hypothetical protein [Labrys sp. ZIDIC5]MDZ5454740.1 hypothetical protein [Labrys sp. ZIDIC5]
MRPFTSATLALLGLSALAVPALAGQKCHGHLSRVSACDGCSVTANWTVTRIQRGPDDNHFCTANWRSLGGHAQFSLIQPPRLGTVKFKDYRVEYRGEKLGHDSMVVRHGWLSRANKPMTATVTYDINVVDTL